MKYKILQSIIGVISSVLGTILLLIIINCISRPADFEIAIAPKRSLTDYFFVFSYSLDSVGIVIGVLILILIFALLFLLGYWLSGKILRNKQKSNCCCIF